MVTPVSGFPGAVIILLITGVVALLFGIFLLLDFLKNKKPYHLLWALAFIVVFLAGVVLVLLDDFELLLSPLVAALAALIPGGIAAGLYFSTFEEKTNKIGIVYFLFVLVGVVLIGTFKAMGSPLASSIVMMVHIPSSFSIILLPVYTTVKKETNWTAILMSVGGLLISLAGVLLAFLVSGNPILDAAAIFTILPILLLIVSAFFAFGMLLPEKWAFVIPGIKR